MSHGNIFTRTEEEEKEHYKERTAEMKQDWERETTKCLLSEIKSRLQGCVRPFCLSCANTDTLVDVLRERFEIEIEKALNHDKNR